MNFDSGWEWGYWLNDVITARASWDPIMNINTADNNNNGDNNNSDNENNNNNNDWIAFEKSLEPFIRIFGNEISILIKDFLISLTKTQLDLLIYGKINGKESEYIDKLSGIAYLSGTDTWYDLPRMFGLKFTQPDKVHIDEKFNPLYNNAVELLYEMKEKFNEANLQFNEIMNKVHNKLNKCPNENFNNNDDNKNDNNDNKDDDMTNEIDIDPNTYLYLLELSDAIQMLALRANHVYLLYKSNHPLTSDDNRAILQGEARNILINASIIVNQREKYYRVPWQRIASWRDNPTVYRFGYLWAVHSLYYWWRDQGLSERGSIQSQMSPCYLNRMDASEVAVGWGKKALEFLRYLINTYSPFSTGYPLEIVNCIAPPGKEYVFPRDLYHH